MKTKISFVFFTIPFLFVLTNAITASNLEVDSLELLGDKHEFIVYDDFFDRQENYIPGRDMNTSIKTIYLAYHVWQDQNGEGNFRDDQAVFQAFDKTTERLNHFFSRSSDPSHPVEGIEYLKDSHIRFELKSIYFHRDSLLSNVGCNAGKRMNDYVFQRHPEAKKYLNMHFTNGYCVGASGYANYPSPKNLLYDNYVVTLIQPGYDDPENYPFWGMMIHLAHELGHNFNLRHPYNSEYCRFSDPDFLFDLFGFEKQSNCKNPRSSCDICYHNKGWTCDSKDPASGCTNNIMGGTASAGNITPLQMGRMNRALANTSVRKYAWGYSDKPLVVSENQVWNRNLKFYNNIVVKKGAMLWIKNDLEMVPGSKIIVETGAKLIVDNAHISSALHASEKWGGVQLGPAEKKGFLFWKKTIPAGEIIILNNGYVEHEPLLNP
ncbi:MAG: M43 family zinc metalloprotease [Bacteroidota bacterium]